MSLNHDWHPKPEKVRNNEIAWLLAVDELAESLKSLEKPCLEAGKTFADSAKGD